MLDLLTLIKYLLKLDDVCIDNSVFRLHYKATAFLLAICSIIITSKQYIGDPIDCILGSSTDKIAVNTYCWIFSTFTLNGKSQHRKHNIPYPGIGPEDDNSEIAHQKYYQWVCFILAIQSAMFILPHCLWRVWEGGRVKTLVADLTSPVTPNWTAERKLQTIRYLSSSNLNNLNLYALQFLFCELLNTLNVFCQICVWNQVFGNRFLTFGFDAIQYLTSDDISQDDPMTALFPKITKCNFRYYGPSGSIQQIDAICVLPLNILNEKMFLFLWGWFFLLAGITFLGLLYDIVLYTEPFVGTYVLQARARYVPRHFITVLVRRGTIGHWFFLHQLGRNLNPFVFGDLLIDLARSFDQTKRGFQLNI